jgi:hypothetical protein
MASSPGPSASDQHHPAEGARLQSEAHGREQVADAEQTLREREREREGSAAKKTNRHTRVVKYGIKRLAKAWVCKKGVGGPSTIILQDNMISPEKLYPGA